MKRLFMTVVAASLMTSAPIQAADISDLGWLSGCWVQTTGDRVVEEQWLAPAGGLALGVSRTLRGGAVRSYEYMRIEAVEGVPTFFAMPSGQAPASFPAVRQTNDEIVFENTTHDFPQQIVYRHTDTGLHAHISGSMSGETRTITFNYQRCEP